MLSTVASEMAGVRGDMGEEYRRTTVFVLSLSLSVYWRDASSSLSSNSAPPPSARSCELVSKGVRQPYILWWLSYLSAVMEKCRSASGMPECGANAGLPLRSHICSITWNEVDG